MINYIKSLLPTRRDYYAEWAVLSLRQRRERYKEYSEHVHDADDWVDVREPVITILEIMQTDYHRIKKEEKPCGEGLSYAYLKDSKTGEMFTRNEYVGSVWLTRQECKILWQYYVVCQRHLKEEVATKERERVMGVYGGE